MSNTLRPFTGSSKTINENNSQEIITPKLDSWLTKISSFRKKDLKIVLAESINIERDIDLFKEQKLKLFNPDKLYTKSKWDNKTKALRLQEETPISCPDGAVIENKIFKEDIINQLVNQDLKFTHLGLFVIGVKGLTRKQIGGQVLVVIQDTRLEDLEKSIICYSTVDLNNNRGLLYFTPDYVIPTAELKYLKLIVSTKGYGNFEGHNICTCVGFLGKAVQNTEINFKVNIGGIIEALASKNVRFLKPKAFSIDDIRNDEWDITKLVKDVTSNKQPTKVQTYKYSDGRHTIRFSGFQSIPNDSSEDEENLMNQNASKNVVEQNEKIQKPLIFNCEKFSPDELHELEINFKDKNWIEQDSYLYQNSVTNDIYVRKDLITEWDEFSSIYEKMDDMDVDKKPKVGESTKYPEETIKANPKIYDYTTGNYPRQSYNYKDQPRSKQYKSKGPRQPLENFYVPDLLNIAAFSPQIWNSVCEKWKQKVVRQYYQSQLKHTTADEMVKFMETYLDETVKALWENYKKEYPADFKAKILDLGVNPYNFVNTVHNLVTGEDPNSGQILLQRNAVKKLEQLSIKSWNYIVPFLNDYVYNATVSGNAFSTEIGERMFKKLPEPLGSQIEKSYIEFIKGKEKTPFNNIEVRAHYVMKILEERCTYMKIQEQLKLDTKGTCANVYVPQQYGEHKDYKKKYKKAKSKLRRTWGLRRAKTARKNYLTPGRHVRKYNPRREYKKPLSCFTCGKKGHFAKDCMLAKNSYDKKAIVVGECNENLIDIDESFDWSDQESLYSIYTIDIPDEEEPENGIYRKIVTISDSDSSDEERYEYMNTNEDSYCDHDWERNKGMDSIACYICLLHPDINRRAQCKKCYIEACFMCLGFQIKVKGEYTKTEIINMRDHIRLLESRVTVLEQKIDINNMSEKPLSEHDYDSDQRREMEPEAGPSHVVEMKSETICNMKSQNKIIINGILRIQDYSKEVKIFVDTGCTLTLLTTPDIPNKYYKKLQNPIAAQQMDNGWNYYKYIIKNLTLSIKDKCGVMSEPYPMKQVTVSHTFHKSYDIVLGVDFILSMNGSIYINKDYFILSKITTTSPIDNNPGVPEEALKTSELREKLGGNNDTKNSKFEKCPGKGHPSCTCDTKISEACNEVCECNEIYRYNYDEVESLCEVIEKCEYYVRDLQELNNSYMEINNDEIRNIIDRLDKSEILGQNPIKHWNKDRPTYKLQIINPDIQIRTAQIKATNEDLIAFREQIQELLNLGAIQKSDSPHRSAAFMVRNHSEIKRGKARMVINYKRLNDNTEDDAYNLPDKETLINRIQNSTYYSKFDCKSGYYQIKMHEDSIPWTAFTTPIGHYEWKVMPFGLKNAPAVFQRRMDQIFGHLTFCAVYIDDVLIFSPDYSTHVNHLRQVLSLFEKHGIIISKSKMTLFKKNIEFLGSEIGNGKIKLQPHISKKILEYPEKFETLKEIQGFLGLLNYARPYIKDLSKLAGPLYSKTRKNGQRFFNQEDIELVKIIKQKCKNLPDLNLPLDSDYLIVETDGSAKGWGATLLRKRNKYDQKSDEKLSRYASGQYREKGNISTIDAELLAIIYALKAFDLYLINKKEFTLRTDCEAIVKYYNNLKNDNKRSVNTRWLNLQNHILSRMYKVNIEHIKGQNNTLADYLSRIFTGHQVENTQAMTSEAINYIRIQPDEEKMKSHIYESDNSGMRIKLFKDAPLMLENDSHDIKLFDSEKETLKTESTLSKANVIDQKKKKKDSSILSKDLTLQKEDYSNINFMNSSWKNEFESLYKANPPNVMHFTMSSEITQSEIKEKIEETLVEQFNLEKELEECETLYKKYCEDKKKREAQGEIFDYLNDCQKGLKYSYGKREPQYYHKVKPSGWDIPETSPNTMNPNTNPETYQPEHKRPNTATTSETAMAFRIARQIPIDRPPLIEIGDNFHLNNYKGRPGGFRFLNNADDGITDRQRSIIDNLWRAWCAQDKQWLYSVIKGMTIYFRTSDELKRNYQFYLVIKARENCEGIYTKFTEVLEAIQGVEQPQYKGYNSYEAALQDGVKIIKKQFRVPSDTEAKAASNIVNQELQINEICTANINLKRQIEEIKTQHAYEVAELKRKLEKKSNISKALTDERFEIARLIQNEVHKGFSDLDTKITTVLQEDIATRQRQYEDVIINALPEIVTEKMMDQMQPFMEDIFASYYGDEAPPYQDSNEEPVNETTTPHP